MNVFPHDDKLTLFFVAVKNNSSLVSVSGVLDGKIGANETPRRNENL